MRSRRSTGQKQRLLLVFSSDLCPASAGLSFPAAARLVQSAGAAVSIAETRRAGRHCAPRLKLHAAPAERTMRQAR
jgi:hypothetical protein